MTSFRLVVPHLCVVAVFTAAVPCSVGATTNDACPATVTTMKLATARPSRCLAIRLQQATVVLDLSLVRAHAHGAADAAQRYAQFATELLKIAPAAAVGRACSEIVGDPDAALMSPFTWTAAAALCMPPARTPRPQQSRYAKGIFASSEAWERRAISCQAASIYLPWSRPSLDVAGGSPGPRSLLCTTVSQRNRQHLVIAGPPAEVSTTNTAPDLSPSTNPPTHAPAACR